MFDRCRWLWECYLSEPQYFRANIWKTTHNVFKFSSDYFKSLIDRHKIKNFSCRKFLHTVLWWVIQLSDQRVFQIS